MAARDAGRTVGQPAHKTAPLQVRRPAAPSSAHPVLAMQRRMGNRAVGRLLKRTRAAQTIMRHSSWEHTLIGDTDPEELGRAAVPGVDKGHLLSREWSRIQAFSANARLDPRGRFPEYRWMQLSGSKLWITYGELNALADYLPDPGTIDSLTAAEIIPVVQRMRQGMLAAIRTSVGFPGGAMAGAAWSKFDFVPGMEAAADVSALDKATAGLGTNRYQGLLARNACHFAPMSWQRWALYHNQAREEALEYNGGMCRPEPIANDVDATADEHMRQAWLNNGYADHFLQDSFAAGHLVNKTLVMQWFAQYLADLPLFRARRLFNPLAPPLPGLPERPVVGVPGKSELLAMTESAQPGVAGRHLYKAALTGLTSEADRARGMTALDPQSAQERSTRGGRVAGSGVQANEFGSVAENYQTYLDMLNSSYLQLAAGAAHDYFNERGLWISNDRGDELRVGGDDTLLKAGTAGKLGTEVTAEAAHMSQQAIRELQTDGTTSITPEKIFELVPKFIWVQTDGAWTKLGLEEWQDAVLKDLCFSTIFPGVVQSVKSDVVRGAASEMVEAGISMDQD